jgi:hydroxypyruvate reductase/glycerate 2-kinase
MTPPSADPSVIRDHAWAIWSAAVNAVRPAPLANKAVQNFPATWREVIQAAPRIHVVGCGKAGAGMAFGFEQSLLSERNRLAGLVNVPEGGDAARLRLLLGGADRVIGAPDFRVRLNPARPVGSNHPTAAGVAGAREMLELLASAGPDDVVVCLLSGGGSALLPLPADGITLDDKQDVTRLLHASGATIGEMNTVRKHLSGVKGGRLAEAFRGKLLVSLIISDVVGDPLDVIASGPTAPDPTTFAEALVVLDRYRLTDQVPASVVGRLRAGAAGTLPETPKQLPPNVHNLVIGSNAVALEAARSVAEQLRYRVVDLGPFIEGEARDVGTAVAGIVRNIREREEPVPTPACILVGGETTVALGEGSGKGGRNQEFVLAATAKLGIERMAGVCVLSGGTDGEDGPTDAAGAVATVETLRRAAELGLDPRGFLERHDSYHFFDPVGGLIRTGLTDTNVMDVRVILVV